MKSKCIVFLACLLFFSCTVPMMRIDNPRTGKKPGMVMLIVFDAQDWGGDILAKQMASVKLSKMEGKYFQAIKTTDAGLKTVGYAKYIISNFQPGDVYVLRGFTASNNFSGSFNSMNLNLTDPENVFRITEEPGKIKFAGLLATHSTPEGFELVNGLELLQKMSTRIVDFQDIRSELFGEYDMSQNGAFKHFLDVFIENQDEGYWKNLALKTKRSL